MEDALLTPESLSILTGSGIIEASAKKPIFIHSTTTVEAIGDGIIEVSFDEADVPEIGEIVWNGGRNPGYTKATVNTVLDGDLDKHYDANGDVYCMLLDGHGEVNVEPCVPAGIKIDEANKKVTIYCDGEGRHGRVTVKAGDVVLIDYYIKKVGEAMQINISPDTFGGNFYLEADTLYRRESDGKDMPAEYVIPNCKVQSNFSFSMAANGDPAAFTFTMDAFPDYTKFDRTEKVFAAIQVVTTGAKDEGNNYRENCDAELGF